MLGDIAVKHMAKAENSKPAIKEKGIMIKAVGRLTSPKAMTTISISEAFMRPLVAPQSISPAMTSSKLRGVAIIASKVF